MHRRAFFDLGACSAPRASDNPVPCSTTSSLGLFRELLGVSTQRSSKRRESKLLEPKSAIVTGGRIVYRTCGGL